MPFEILIMILAFLLGCLFQYFEVGAKVMKPTPKTASMRRLFYKIVVGYLLFKIGFGGGKALASEPLNQVLFTSLVAVVASIFWTFFTLVMLKAYTSFNRTTQISIATHFGSVSVGTFIAGMAFLEALQIPVTPSVVVWLALMELPAVLVGMYALKVKAHHFGRILTQDSSLMILIGAIFLGVFGGGLMPENFYNFAFVLLFPILLTYFLFEMGRKAAATMDHLKSQFKAFVLVGTLLPLVGGISGACLAGILGYNPGEAFAFSILMGSASYVLVPITLYEVLKSSDHISKKEATQSIATSMALSVGITLPFNIIIGFEIYHVFITHFLATSQVLWVGVLVPFILFLCACFRKGTSK